MPDIADMAQRDTESLQEALQRFKPAESTEESLHDCDECGNEIPESRRLAVKGCTLCLECKAVAEHKQRTYR
jgi:phage/conjugal plasmid C-4 type zinc finger TraR family protein